MKAGKLIAVGEVSHSYGRFLSRYLLVGMQDKARGACRMSGDAVVLPEYEVKTLMTPITPPSWCAALGRVESELVGLQGKALARDSIRRFRFVHHAASWLHSMMLNECSVVGNHCCK